MTPEQQAGLHAILGDPDDDTPRLMYADWLEENGQPERAAFIRVQCELAKIDPHIRCGGYYCQTYDTGNTMHVDCRSERLRLEERKLWPYVIQNMQDLPNVDMTWITTADWIPDSSPPQWGRATVRRGFIESVALTTADFLTHAATLAATVPLREVRLTDREPYFSHYSFTGTGWDHYVWFNASIESDLDARSHLGHDIFSYLHGGYRRNTHVAEFSDREAAHLALSTACLAFARQQAVAEKLVPKSVEEAWRSAGMIPSRFSSMRKPNPPPI